MVLGMCLLVIDSNRQHTLLYKRKMLASFTEVDFCSSTEQALRKLRRRKYDAIILSHQLKNSSGLTAYKTLRQEGYKGDIIIAVTGQDKSDIRRSYNGISGIINKCLYEEDFNLTIRKFLNSTLPEDSSRKLTDVPTRS